MNQPYTKEMLTTETGGHNRQNAEKAIGFIETLGMVPALYGADTMLKAANVRLIAYENIGSTLVTVMIKGDVGAVQASVAAGAAAAASIGQLTASNVLPCPTRGIGNIVSLYSIEDEAADNERPHALGFVETFGIVYALQAADAMDKAAAVDLIGFENVASGYISILVQGDVASCQSAVDAGIKSVERMEAEVYSSIVIPTPHPELIKLTRRYFMENLVP